jgi:uncharacterized protein
MSGSRSSFQFNLVYRQGRAAENEDLLVSAEEGAQFLVEAYEAWEASGRESQVTPFADLVDWFDSDRENPPRLTCWFMGRCNETHIGIDSDLNIAGCGRRLDFANFYGNLRNQSIASVLEASQERKKIGVRSELLAKGECAGCKFFPICHGGCPDDAALDTGDVAGRSPDCAAFKKLFEVMAARADAGVKHLDPPVLQQTPRTMVHLATDAGIVSDITRPYER